MAAKPMPPTVEGDSELILLQLKTEAKEAYDTYDKLLREQVKALEKTEKQDETALKAPAKAAGSALKVAKEKIQDAKENWEDWCKVAKIAKSTANRLIRELETGKADERRKRNREAMRNIRLGSHKAPCSPSDTLSTDQKDLIAKVKKASNKEVKVVLAAWRLPGSIPSFEELLAGAAALAEREAAKAEAAKDGAKPVPADPPETPDTLGNERIPITEPETVNRGVVA